MKIQSQYVALLAEGVDRNLPMRYTGSIRRVALLAEGVDRNLKAVTFRLTVFVSPSSRRAWIEITMAYTRQGTVIVALLAEGVDRN